MDEGLIRSIRPVSILVAGDVMVDEYVMGEVERISPESPVPVVVVRDRLRRLGGAGNVAKNLVSMGGKVALFATVGNDSAGRWFRERCESLAVEGFWLKDDPVRPTTIKTRVVARNQQLVRIDEENVGYLGEDLERAVIKDVESVVSQVKAVILSDYGKGFLTSEVIRVLIDRARAHGIPVLVDPKGRDFERYRGAHYITPNVREASLAAGVEIVDEESLERAGRIVLEKADAEGIVITRGKKGSTLVTADRVAHFPVKPVEIIDVTGAGDTVVATLAMCVANGMTIDESIAMANFAASLVVARFGAASVTIDEMLESVDESTVQPRVVGIEHIGHLLRNQRIRGQTVVFTNGCFDLLHAGHLKILKEASEQGDILVVGINSDASVRRIKDPSRPVVPQEERVQLVSALSFVDYVVVFDEDTPLELIKEVRPDVLVKGEDWRGKTVVGSEIVEARGGRIMFVEHLKGISTTNLIDRIRNSGENTDPVREYPPR